MAWLGGVPDGSKGSRSSRRGAGVAESECRIRMQDGLEVVVVVVVVARVVKC